MASIEIHSVQTISGNQAQIRRIIEESGQTFKAGTPVMMKLSDGTIQAWDGATINIGIAGFSTESASNLTTDGVAKTLTFGSVPNQASAVNIPRGAPLNDGRVGFEVANDDTIFRGQVGPAQVAVAADVGKEYGMSIDTDNQWYVDRTKSTVGTNTLAKIIKLDPNDQAASPRGVYFRIVSKAQQFGGTSV